MSHPSERHLLADPIRRALAVTSAIAAAGLTLFHGVLLWRRLVDQTLLEPTVILRWSLALMLTAAAVILRRRGGSLVRGRAAIALWLMVALLHAGAPLPAQAAEDFGALLGDGAGMLLALPLVLVCTLFGGLATGSVGRAVASASWRFLTGSVPPARPLAGILRPILARPPPTC